MLCSSSALQSACPGKVGTGVVSCAAALLRSFLYVIARFPANVLQSCIYARIMWAPVCIGCNGK